MNRELSASEARGKKNHHPSERDEKTTLHFTTLTSQFIRGQLLSLCGLETVTIGLSILRQAEESLHI